MIWIAFIVAVLALFGLWRFVQAWRADNRAAGIRQEMQRDHARDDRVKQLAEWRDRQENL